METGNGQVRYEYRFKRHVDIDDVQDTLTLSILGAENLHGRSRLRLDGWWRLDRQRRSCLIDASTAVGADLAKLFTGYLAREFGEGSFQVLRPGSAARGDSHERV